MRAIVITFALLVVSCDIITPAAKPYRQKRVSDQRLAELETLLALSKMRGKLVTVPVGFGRINPEILGRRRRTIESDFRDLFERTSNEQAEGDWGEEELANIFNYYAYN